MGWGLSFFFLKNAVFMIRVRVRLGLFRVRVRVRLGLFSVRVKFRLGLFRVRVRVSINPNHNPKTDL